MSQFIPSLSARPQGFGGVDIGESAQKLVEDPLIFQKMNAEIGGNGWAGPSSRVDDIRWGQPWIYPGTGRIDWKKLKGDQYVFVFLDDNLSSGWWQDRDFFNDVFSRGWIRSKSWKYVANGPDIIKMPSDPWILKFANTSVGRFIYNVGKDLKPTYTDIGDIFSNVGQGVVGTAKIVKYVPWIIGGAVAIWLFKSWKK